MSKRELLLEEEQSLYLQKDEFDENSARQLYKHHGHRVSIDFPSPVNNQCYVLRSKGCVGQIPLSHDLVLRIRPKVPIDNIFRMLEYAYNLKSFDFLKGNTRVDSIDDLFERLALILARRVLERVRKGIYMSYTEKEEALPYLRGRVLILPSLHAAMRGSTRLECEYEDYTGDLDDNRIIAWTLFLLMRHPFNREDVNRLVRKAYKAISGVVETRCMDVSDCIGRFYNRINKDYRPLHGLCRFFLEHVGPDLQIGTHEFIPFVVDMPRLFESFVAEWLKANPPERVQVKSQYNAELKGSDRLKFTIDLVLTDIDTDQVLAVMDTKYKREELPSTEDIQQIVAYAVRMKTYNALLIYPSALTTSDCIKLDKIKVRSLVFDVGTTLDAASTLFSKELRRILECT